jgi:hypothetical protein
LGSDRRRDTDLEESGAVIGVQERTPAEHAVVQLLEKIVVTPKWLKRMQSAGDGSLVCRKGSGFEETQLCVLSPRCEERNFPVDCLLFRELPILHQVSLLAAGDIC